MSFPAPLRNFLTMLCAALVLTTLSALIGTPTATAEPTCKAFAVAPELTDRGNGDLQGRGGATCTAKGTGLFRVDVTLTRDGDSIHTAVNAECAGERQCGGYPHARDEPGNQRWCTSTVAVWSGDPTLGGGTSRTQTCEDSAEL